MKRRFQHPIHLHREPYYIHVLSISSVCYYQTALEIYIRKNKKMSLNNYLLRFPTLCLFLKTLFETKLENKTLVLLVLLFLIWAITQTDVRNLIGSTHATHIHTNKNPVSIIVWTSVSVTVWTVPSILSFPYSLILNNTEMCFDRKQVPKRIKYWSFKFHHVLKLQMLSVKISCFEKPWVDFQSSISVNGEYETDPSGLIRYLDATLSL